MPKIGEMQRGGGEVDGDGPPCIWNLADENVARGAVRDALPAYTSAARPYLAGGRACATKARGVSLSRRGCRRAIPIRAPRWGPLG